MAQANQPEPFGPYLLLRPLGRGGMGVVYVARSRRTDHPVVAVKRLRADAALVPSFKERFEHECALALRLRHPRLVHTLDAGEVQGVPYVASELILGQDVGAVAERLLVQGRGAPLKIAVRITIDMLAGLDYVHQAREPTGRPLELVHRDVTPGNVLVGYDGIGRLADFGLAKSLLTEQLQLTATGTILGTPKFLAPEVAMGQTADLRADLYGLGAVIYRLLVGRGPYEGDPREVLEAVLAGPPRSIEVLRPDLPPWFVSVVRNLMAREPDRRPRSAREAGLVLVEAARANDALLARNRVGQWLRDLFADEHAQQLDAVSRDRAVDVSLVPAGKGTRVLKAAQAPLEAPASAADGDVDYDGNTLKPDDARVGTVAAGETETAWRPDPGALTEVGDWADRDERIDDRRADDSFGAPTHLAHLDTPPSPGPRAVTAKIEGDGGRPNRFLVALLAAALGLALGLLVTFRSEDPWGKELAERLGAAKRATVELRAAGISVPPDVDVSLDAVRRSLVADELMKAQLELQEVELTLDHLR